jgi:hypothetical protein
MSECMLPFVRRRPLPAGPPGNDSSSRRGFASANLGFVAALSSGRGRANATPPLAVAFARGAAGRRLQGKAYGATHEFYRTPLSGSRRLQVLRDRSATAAHRVAWAPRIL